jgi:hypothetical protein
MCIVASWQSDIDKGASQSNPTQSTLSGLAELDRRLDIEDVDRFR